MIEIDENKFITAIWESLAPGYHEITENDIDCWPEAQGLTEQLYAQMMGWA